MRRIALAVGFIACLLPARLFAGPGSASGPITVDSSTFVAGMSVMGTDGGVYSDNLPPIGSTTTAAFRMTKYRAEHVNLRDASGLQLGVAGNPLYTTASSTITIGVVTVTNSSFSVTGSTVNIRGTVPVSIAGTLPVSVQNDLRVYVATTNVSGSTVSLTNTGFAVTNTPSIHFADSLPLGNNNIGTVTGSTVTLSNTGFAVTNTPNVNVANTPTVTANAGSGTFKVTGSTVVVTGTVSVGNQLTVNSLTQVKNGAGNALTVGWDAVGSSVPVHEIGTANVHVTNSPTVVVSASSSFTVFQSTASNLRASVFIDGSSNTVQIAGTVPVTSTIVNVATVTFNGTSQPVTASQATPASLQASVSINGSSSTVTAIQATGTNLHTVVDNTVAVAGSVKIDGSSNTVVANQGGNWTTTAIQTTPSSLQASVSINGSSNTVAAAQSGAWTSTVSQGTNSSLRASVMVDGSSNTVTAIQGTNASLRASVQIDGSSNTVQITGTPTANVQQVTGARWNVSFSTITTTAVLASTAITTNVSISTPIAGVSSQTVRVYRLTISVDAATNITLRDGATNFGDTYYLTANGSLVLDLSNEPWYITSSSNGFVVKQSGSANMGIHVSYTQS